MQTNDETGVDVESDPTPAILNLKKGGQHGKNIH